MARRSSPRPASPDTVWQVLYGANEHTRRRALAALLDELAPEPEREFALDRLSGGQGTAAAIIAAAQTVPFLAPRRVVLVAAAQELPRAEQQALARLVGQVYPPAVVILEVTAQEERRRAPLEQPLWKALAGCARLLEFAQPSEQEASRWAMEAAGNLGVTLEPAAAAALLQRLGSNQAILERELEKLATYVGAQGRITRQVVGELSPRLPEDDIFALTDAIGERRTGLALGLLGDLMRFHHQPPPRILFMIARQFRQLWQARLLAEAGWRAGQPVPPPLSDRLPDPAAAERMPAWLYGRLRQQASRFGWPHLEYAFQRMLQCDLATKDITGAVSRPGLALELLIGDLCHPPGQPGAG